MSKNDVYGNPTYRELQMCYRATDHLDEAKKQIDEALRFTGGINIEDMPELTSAAYEVDLALDLVRGRISQLEKEYYELP